MVLVKRKPTSPGEILREEFPIPLRLTQKQLAGHIGRDFKVINRIVNQKAQVTPTLAIKLAEPSTPRRIFGLMHKRWLIFTMLLANSSVFLKHF